MRLQHILLTALALGAHALPTDAQARAEDHLVLSRHETSRRDGIDASFDAKVIHLDTLPIDTDLGSVHIAERKSYTSKGNKGKAGAAGVGVGAGAAAGSHDDGNWGSGGVKVGTGRQRVGNGTSNALGSAASSVAGQPLVLPCLAAVVLLYVVL